MAHGEFKTYVDTRVRCSEECEHCAEAGLVGADMEVMAECVLFDRDCAVLCWQTAAFMSRGSRFAAEVCHHRPQRAGRAGGECASHKYGHCRQWPGRAA